MPTNKLLIDDRLYDYRRDKYRARGAMLLVTLLLFVPVIANADARVNRKTKGTVPVHRPLLSPCSTTVSAVNVQIFKKIFSNNNFFFFPH